MLARLSKYWDLEVPQEDQRGRATTHALKPWAYIMAIDHLTSSKGLNGTDYLRI